MIGKKYNGPQLNTIKDCIDQIRSNSILQAQNLLEAKEGMKSASGQSFGLLKEDHCLDEFINRTYETIKICNKTQIFLIAAYDRARTIGREGKIPWKLKSDMKRFKEITTEHTVVMGRKTWESLGKPLKDRKNIVLTSDESYGRMLRTSGVDSCTSILQLLNSTEGVEKMFIIGGSRLYKEFMPFADGLYITEVDFMAVGGDAFFPQIPAKLFEEKFRGNFGYSDGDEVSSKYIEYKRR